MNHRIFCTVLAISSLLIRAHGAHGEEPAATPSGDPPAMSLEAPADDTLPEHHAADSAAPEVTKANLFTSERFWPYHVHLTRAWKPKGAGEARAGTKGVLIRVESSGRARIDFGRAGLGDVPIDSTDLVARANEIRLGTLAKRLPNFVEAIGPRLLSPEASPATPVSLRRSVAAPGFLCVFADPRAESFGELARSLAPLADRAGVMTIFFPQGRAHDAVVAEKMRALEWKAAFVFHHLAEPYTATLVDADATFPRVALQTREGRLLLEREWKPEVAAELGAAIDAAFAAP